MNVVMVGAGNVATRLGEALQGVPNVRVTAVYSRTMAAAQALAGRLGAKATDALAQLPAADVYVLSVSDAALESVVRALCPLHPDALFVHTAGSMPLGVFDGAARRAGVLYPMQTFSKRRAVDFGRVPCFVEGRTGADLEAVTQLARKVSRDVRPLDSTARRQLHLAAVFACNFANHCYAMAHRLIAACGLPFEVLLPLIDETAAKVHELSPEEAQTGPAVRYDTNVMQRQEAALADPALREIYKAMSLQIHRYAERPAQPNEP